MRRPPHSRARESRAPRAEPAHGRSHGWVRLLKTAPPEPFFDSGRSLATVCPETALLCAVLEDALACFYDAADPELAREAERWFFTDRDKTAFSFVSLCEALELMPEEIRNRLTRARAGAAGGKDKKAARRAGAKRPPPGPVFAPRPMVGK